MLLYSLFHIGCIMGAILLSMLDEYLTYKKSNISEPVYLKDLLWVITPPDRSNYQYEWMYSDHVFDHSMTMVCLGIGGPILLLSMLLLLIYKQCILRYAYPFLKNLTNKIINIKVLN